MRLLALSLIATAMVACAPPYPGESQAENQTPPPVEIVTADPNDLQSLRIALAERLPGTKLDAVRPTPIDGLFEVQSGMSFGYVSADGRYLIQGDMNDLISKRGLTEDRRRTVRADLVKGIEDDQVIEFAPNNEAQFSVTVFTDIDCGYCRKLHQQIAEYNNRDIAVRYVFFPRSGPNTPSYHKAERVWCAEDQRAAMTQAKTTGDYKGEKSCQTPVMDHLRLARALGLRGTPAILLQDGELVPGYHPPDQLLQLLVEHSALPG
ncbi:MAG: DsbC family protein [Panacagrimonas sp.]